MQGAIPTPQDDNLLLQATTTQTVSFNTPSYDAGAGFVPGGRGMRAVGVMDVSALVGTGTYTAKLQESSDNATFTDIGLPLTIAAVGVVGCDGLQNKRYVRIAFTIGGTSPSITVKAWANYLSHQ